MEKTRVSVGLEMEWIPKELSINEGDVSGVNVLQTAGAPAATKRRSESLPFRIT